MEEPCTYTPIPTFFYFSLFSCYTFNSPLSLFTHTHVLCLTHIYMHRVYSLSNTLSDSLPVNHTPILPLPFLLFPLMHKFSLSHTHTHSKSAFKRRAYAHAIQRCECKSVCACVSMCVCLCACVCSWRHPLADVMPRCK